MQYSLVDEAFDNYKIKTKNINTTTIHDKESDCSTISSELSSLPNIDQESVSDSDLSMFDAESHQFDHKKFIRNFIQELDDNRSLSMASLLSNSSSRSKSHLQTCKYCQMQIEYKLKLMEKKKQEQNQQPLIENIHETGSKGLEIKDIIIIGLIGVLIIIVIEVLFRFRR